MAGTRGADIARQIAVYRQGGEQVVVATCYPMDREDRATLTANGIRQITLGPDFLAYCEARRNAPPPESGNIL